jgi:integrase
METVATYPTIKLALRLILLTLVRKSELIQATWDEVDFENATWTIPKQRMKGRNPHVVYLSRQALDIFVTLHACAAAPVRLSFSLRSTAVHVQCDLESHHDARGRRR